MHAHHDRLTLAVADSPQSVAPAACIDATHDLEISPRTVEIYRANVMTKMQAKSLSHLVRMVLIVTT